MDAYYIWTERDDEPAGPYTISQMRSMWNSGQLNLNAQVLKRGEPDWQSISIFVPELESSFYVRPNRLMSDSDAHSSVVQQFEIQNRLKSVTTAALLSIFIPFFGAAYGAGIACVVPLLLSQAIGFIFALMMNVKNQDAPTVFVVTAGIGYLVSIFWSIASVKSDNDAVIAKAKGDSGNDLQVGVRTFDDRPS